MKTLYLTCNSASDYAKVHNTHLQRLQVHASAQIYIRTHTHSHTHTHTHTNTHTLTHTHAHTQKQGSTLKESGRERVNKTAAERRVPLIQPSPLHLMNHRAEDAGGRRKERET